MMFSSSLTVFATENTVEIKDEQNSNTPEDSVMVSSGYLKVNADGSVIITDKYIQHVEAKLSEAGINATVSATDNTITIQHFCPTKLGNVASASASSGVTKIEWLSFFRFKIYLDNDLSHKVSNSISMCGALSPWIPDPTITKIVGSALVVASGLIKINNNGKGVIISGIFSFQPPIATFYWIQPQ
jgi:hypothetical protein